MSGMAAAALPPRAVADAPPEVVSLRRQRYLEDRAYTLALVAGCLLGIGISWQAVLSDGARARLMAGLFGLTERAGVAELAVAGEPLPPAPEGISPPPAPPTLRPGSTPEVSTPSRTPATLVRAASVPLPERLVLDDENESAVAAAPKPLTTAEIVFAINSSYLGPSDVAELRRLVAAAPRAARLRLAIVATVSDEPLKNAGSDAAERYNRWLAERRADRIAEFLRRHVREPVSVEIAFLPHDASRRVTVDVWPAS